MLTPTNKALLAPQYYGSVYYYALLMSCREAVIDNSLRYDKRFKSVHRTTIVDTRGPLIITVPVSRPAGESVRQWRQMQVSSHGQWWADHRVSLESAYGRTPYFEFYIDRFLPYLSDNNIPVTELDQGIDEAVRAILQLDAQVSYSTDDVDIDSYIDCRRGELPQMHTVPYYQVRADKLGFVAGLSILDLIFNMGTEAPLVLYHMVTGREWRHR